MIKAVAGGGGRGIRLVRSAAELPRAFERAASEAERSSGDSRVYVEQALAASRHVEIQVLGDGPGQVTDLGDRDCTLQRRHQKLIEIAPSPFIGPGLRDALRQAATRMAAELALSGAATFEFFLDAERGEFAFLEANPRLQVEHTVTEQVTSIDLVLAQLAVADGQSLADLGIADRSRPRGYAVQARVNTEIQPAQGPPSPGTGTHGQHLPASPAHPGRRARAVRDLRRRHQPGLPADHPRTPGRAHRPARHHLHRRSPARADRGHIHASCSGARSP